MNTLLFSTTGVIYEDGGSSAVQALYIPSRARVQTFADIPHPDNKSVKMRYGDIADTAPLWRTEGPFVRVYGDVPKELSERRVGVEVHLPQDLVPEDVTVFFMIFGARYVVFGRKEISEDQKEDWGISLIDCEENGVVDFLINSVSERMLVGGGDNMLISAHQSDGVLAELNNGLEPFGIEVQDYRQLKVDRNAKALYHHRDYGILMLACAMISFFLLVASLAYFIVNYLEVSRIETEIAGLDEQIRKTNRNKHLGHVRNPSEVLELMKPLLVTPPSAILNAAAQAASQLGQPIEIALRDRDIPLKGRRPVEDRAVVRVFLSEEEGLLLDQERAAKVIVKNSPWIRRLERPEGARGVELEVEVQTIEPK